MEVDSYDWMYNDAGTGADASISIWRPTTLEAGFCALGDVAHGTHATLTIPTFMVKALQHGALANPIGFTEVSSSSRRV